MNWLKVVMFLVGVLIVLVGLALLLSVRIEEMREQGRQVGPGEWVALIDSIARLWNQIMIGVARQYVTGLTVLLIGIIVMSIPIALPVRKTRVV
jgi:hypothetical protein